jgi:AraC-like DNA-binding protein
LCGDFLTQRVEDAERQVAWNWGHWLDDMRHDTPERRRVLLLEMEALLMRMALARNGDNGAVADVPRTPGKGSMTHLNRVGQIATYIGTHYAEPLTTAQIADAVGLHPNYAVTLFRKLTGTTIIDFLTKQRLSHAQLLLATTQMNVLDIAMESGFGSASRFYAVFKDAFQMSPRQYREMIRTARHVSEAHYAGTRRSRSRSSGRAGRAKG